MKNKNISLLKYSKISMGILKETLTQDIEWRKTTGLGNSGRGKKFEEGFIEGLENALSIIEDTASAIAEVTQEPIPHSLSDMGIKVSINRDCEYES